MFPRPFLLLLAPSILFAQTPGAPLPPVISDPSLRIELIATVPDVEDCTTVCGDPHGAIYIGNDLRDGKIDTLDPICTIVRISGTGPGRKRTVFADKLYSPAGSAWFDGWLYVIHDPFMTRFRDTNGDGVADVREDLITNLGVMPQNGLNDHCASGFTLGMDGCWYISIGDRGTYQTKSVKDGSTISLQGGGIIRCRTDGTRLEIFSSGTRNHLQVNLDAEDNAFTRDNTDDGNGWWTRLTHHIEGGYYGYPYDYRSAPNYGVIQPSKQTLDAIKQFGGSVVEPQRSEEAKFDRFLPAMADFGGGSPTGGLCYLSDGLPEKYRGKHFFSEWGKAGLFVTEVARDGATFKLVSDTKLVEPAKGGEFRPMQIAVAADGSLLIADWGYGGWKGPRVAGAVWRLYWPEAKPAPRLKDESKANVDDLIAALGHPDRDQRLRAQTSLMGMGEAIAKKLSASVKDPRRPSLVRIHGLWALNRIARDVEEAIHKVNYLADTAPITTQAQSILGELMNGKDELVKAQAIRAFGHHREGGVKYAVIERLIEALKTGAAPVRLEAAIAEGRLWGYEPGSLVAALNDDDPWVRNAVMTAIRRNMWNPRIGTEHGPSPHVRTELPKALTSTNSRMRDAAWSTLSHLFDARSTSIRMTHWNDGKRYETGSLLDAQIAALNCLADAAKSPEAEIRVRATRAYGDVAYEPKPWDGKWWGTQPVKNPPAPKSVAWSGTPKILEALTTALADPDKDVRLTAAHAFTKFTLDDAAKAAGAALRARLTAETESAIRRQLIESLGVQKDPQAMDAFMQIALDEKADADFRDTAIGAVVNIGGDAAKKTIAKLADAKLSVSATRKVIVAAGELKVFEAAPSLIAHLKDEYPGNRELSAKALRQLGPKSNATPALIEALGDKDSKVQVAAVEALGSLRDKAALPPLIALAEKRKFHRETIEAIANMADATAVPVLVEAVREKDTSMRRNALKALRPYRQQAWPLIEDMIANGRVPEELVPGIRNFIVSGAITKWKMIGVFENVWEAVHPPEKDALDKSGVPELTKKYHNAEGKDSTWRDVTADPASGEVDLQKVFNTDAMVCAYAYAEIDTPEPSDAKIFADADDELAIWLNGKSVFNQGGSHGFEADRHEIPVQLPAGKNALFVKIGNKGGAWIFNLRMPGFEDGKFIKSKEPAPEEKQRTFVLAAKSDGSYLNAGNPKNGEKLFFDQTSALAGICATCHTVKGKGGQIGPDLSTVGANYKRPDLIVSIFEPSKTIALGFEQVMIETNSGEAVAGFLRSETGDALSIVDAAGQSRSVKKSDIKKKTDLHTSLMPPSLTQALKPEELADLLAYLESLK
jgi:putative membrane-bound dehydrogenase-like protein